MITMNDHISRAITTVLTAGVISTCGILWKMSETLVDIKHTVNFMQKDFEKRITENEKDIEDFIDKCKCSGKH